MILNLKYLQIPYQDNSPRPRPQLDTNDSITHLARGTELLVFPCA